MCPTKEKTGTYYRILFMLKKLKILNVIIIIRKICRVREQRNDTLSKCSFHNSCYEILQNKKIKLFNNRSLKFTRKLSSPGIRLKKRQNKEASFLVEHIIVQQIN